MPHAVDEDLEKGKLGLVVILPEVQGTAAETLPGFVLNMFPKLQARVCSGGGFPLPHFSGIPHTTVIGVDGTLLFDGGSFETKKIDAAVEAELEKVKKGWGPTPEIKRVRALHYGKLDFAEAKKALAAITPAPDAVTLQQLGTEIDRALESRLRSAKFLVEAGRVGEAKALIAKLLSGTKGLEAATATLAGLEKALSGPEAEKEAAADKKISDALTRYRAKALPGAAAPQAFEAIAKSCAGTKSAARASTIAKALVSGANAKR